MAAHGYRARLFSLIDDPAGSDGPQSYIDYPDGLLVVEDGIIVAVGDYGSTASAYPGITLTHFPSRIIAPGFVDAHVHYPQTDMIASYSPNLLDWLSQHTFRTEMKLADKRYAQDLASFFIGELLRNGTTSALVFGTVHAHSVDALLSEAEKLGMRLIAGKVLMDRGAPPLLLDPPGGGLADTQSLIKTWHGRGRLGYAVTPRFAITSSGEQLKAAAAVLAQNEGVLLHTHLCESKEEIAETARLFPEAADYLDVYDRHGLVGRRSVFAHCVQMDSNGFARLARAGASVVHCPTSNFFLGSGLFDMRTARAEKLRLGLGTDVGAGTSFSLLSTMGAAYSAAQIRGSGLAPLDAYYLATLGGARALHIGDKVGCLAPGYEADFVVLDPAATPLLARRTRNTANLQDLLFVLMTLGDDRAVERTFVAGRQAYGPSH